MVGHSTIPDIQSGADERNIEISRVGVRGVRMPMVIEAGNTPQHTIVEAEMTVSLPAERKGTHMSRFIHQLNQQQSLTPQSLLALHAEMLEKLDAVEGSIDVSFPFFVQKHAPVSGVASLMDYEVAMMVDGSHEDAELSLQVTVPVTSLCPCSKEISRYGAHNQRSHVVMTVLVEPAQTVAIETLIAIAEEASSCPIWATLKRPDEKYVTERAYENPKFVEDIVRDVAAALNQDERVLAYRVSSENFESIHNHSAYAVIEHDKRD